MAEHVFQDPYVAVAWIKERVREEGLLHVWKTGFVPALPDLLRTMPSTRDGEFFIEYLVDAAALNDLIRENPAQPLDWYTLNIVLMMLDGKREEMRARAIEDADFADLYKRIESIMPKTEV